jgi:hypothetical protein
MIFHKSTRELIIKKTRNFPFTFIKIHIWINI